jgi:hypothetical protein
MKVNAVWACKEKKTGQTTCEALVELAEDQGIKLLVLGSYGRKGEKM